MQKIEVFGLGELLRLGDALGKSIPRHDGLDGGKRVATRLLCLQQCLADTPVKPDLFVNRLSRRLELLLMFILRCVEKLPDDAIMQVDDFVGHGSHSFDGHCHESGIAPLRFKPRQIRRRHLTAFASNFQQAVLMNLTLDAGGEIEFVPDFEALDVFEHMA